MTQEEKAKRYDEAIKKLRSLHGDYDTVSTLIDVKEELENIFPELKESEDERIRKSLAAYFAKFKQSDMWDDDFSFGDILAWLEKQGTPAKLSEEEQNKFAKGVLTSCALSFIDYLDTHKYEGKMCVSNGECEDIENAFHNAMWDRLHRYYCKYIEKQGEKKSIDDLTQQEVMDIAVAKCFEQKPAFEMKTPEESLGVDSDTYNKIVDECVYGEQKPTWSEEDEVKINRIVACLENLNVADNDILLKDVDWLKSLRPQSHLEAE